MRRRGIGKIVAGFRQTTSCGYGSLLSQGRQCANGKTPLPHAPLCIPTSACHNRRSPEFPLSFPSPSSIAHPARLILILSLAPTIGLGIGRFAYALVLPDMRESLHWSYSAAGFMNTINAVGYLAGALVASRLIRRYGLARNVVWSTFACMLSLAL